MAKIISNPQVRINNEPFAIVPNSLRVVRGEGESEMKPQTAGAGSIEHVFSKNVETNIGKIMMAAYVTAETIAKVQELKQLDDGNYIAITDGTTTQLVMRKAALVNDPEHAFSNDGQVEIEFHGTIVE